MVPRPYSLIVMATLIAHAAPASAQTGPYRGLFGPGEREAEHPPQLTMAFSVYAGLDDTTSFASGGVLDESLQTGDLHEGATLELAFLRRRPRATIALSGSSALRYYSTLRHVTTQKHGVGLGVELQPTRGLKLRFAEGASFSPTYQLALAQPPRPEGSELTFEPSGVDYSVSRDKQITYASFTSATYAWNPNRDLTAGYNLSYTNFFTRPDFSTQQATVRFTQRLSPDVALRLGYGLGSSALAGLPAVRHHDIDVGVTYSRSLAFSPRTSLGFTSGSTVVSTGSQRQFELLGGVQLRQLLSPRWTSTAAYQRGLLAIDSMPRPFVANTVSGEVSGYLGARTSLTLHPSYSKGVEVGDASRAFNSAVFQTRVDTAVSRHWAVYVEHFYYSYRFAEAAGLPAALAAGLTRQGLRLGLALWAPVIR